MNSKFQDIADQMRRVAHTADGLMFPIMSGKVVAGSVDEAQETCTVILTAGDATGESGVESVETEGVLLNGVSLNNNGMILYPADESDVWVAEIDGPGMYGVIKCSNLVKYSLVIGGTSFVVEGSKITMNGGSLGGLPILQKIADNLNTLKKYIKTELEPQIQAGLNAVGAGSSANGPAAAISFHGAVSGLTIDFEDMENTKIKQG